MLPNENLESSTFLQHVFLQPGLSVAAVQNTKMNKTVIYVHIQLVSYFTSMSRILLMLVSVLLHPKLLQSLRRDIVTCVRVDKEVHLSGFRLRSRL